MARDRHGNHCFIVVKLMRREQNSRMSADRKACHFFLDFCQILLIPEREKGWCRLNRQEDLFLYGIPETGSTGPPMIDSIRNHLAVVTLSPVGLAMFIEAQLLHGYFFI